MLLYSELNDQRCKCRKVEVFVDDSVGYADAENAVGTTRLGEVAVPSDEEINQAEEFEAALIQRDEFEALWSARTSRRVAGTLT